MTEKENLTKNYIFQSFRRLLEKNKYNDVSVCDICEKAGVSRMSFYRNFKSKEDLTYKGFENIIHDLKKRIDALEQKTTYSITKLIYETFRESKSLLYSLDGSDFSKELTDLIFKELSEKVELDYMSKSMKYIPVFYFGAIVVTAMHWLNSGCQESEEEMARMTASLINFEPFETANK